MRGVKDISEVLRDFEHEAVKTVRALEHGELKLLFSTIS
jgi:hypothetical protein